MTDARKKNRVGGCLAAIALLCVLVMFGRMTPVSEPKPPKENVPETSSEMVTLADTSEMKRWKIHYPERVWRDVRGNRLTARVDEILEEKVILRTGAKRKTYLLADFDAADRAYLDALASLGSAAELPRESKLEPRTWNPAGESFEAKLLAVQMPLILLLRDKKAEVWSVTDFVSLDKSYLTEQGF